MRQVFVLGKCNFEWTGWCGMTCPTQGCCMSSGRECRIPKALWRFGRKEGQQRVVALLAEFQRYFNPSSTLTIVIVPPDAHVPVHCYAYSIFCCRFI